MRPLTESELLDAWERGVTASSATRSVDVVRIASDGELTRDVVASLPIGRFDARLFELRCLTFGSRFAGTADCPACAARVEIDVDLGDFETPAPGPEDALTAEHRGTRARFRLPNVGDLEFVSRNTDAATARSVLLERCLIEARDGTGHALVAGALPAGLLDSAVEQMAAADPQADVRLALPCPDCDERWEAPLDIAAILWSDVDTSVRGLLEEIHDLARAYGWTECEVLAIGPARRQAYLEFVRG